MRHKTQAQSKVMMFIDSMRISRLLFGHMLNSAKAGQRLPQLTIILFLHLFFHLFFSFLYPRNNYHVISTLGILFNATLNVSGYVVLIRLYHHSVSTIFNRKLPPTLLQCIPSFAAHCAWVMHISTLSHNIRIHVMIHNKLTSDLCNSPNICLPRY